MQCSRSKIGFAVLWIATFGCWNASARLLPVARLHPSWLHGSGMNAEEQRAAYELVQLANQDRARHGLPPLRQDAALTRAAWKHAQLMVPAGVLSHRLPGEPELIRRVQQAGVQCSTVAENLGEAPTPDQINTGWMHSPPHRANLLDPRVREVGIAVVQQGRELYAVQDFARELTALSRPQQEQQVAGLLRARGLRILAGDSPARSYCGGTPQATRPVPRLITKYTSSNLDTLPQAVEQRIETYRFHAAQIAACNESHQGGFTSYQIVLLFY